LSDDSAKRYWQVKRFAQKFSVFAPPQPLPHLPEKDQPVSRPPANLVEQAPLILFCGHLINPPAVGRIETVSKVILLDGGEGKGETGWLDSTPLGCRDNSFCHHRAS